MPGGLPTGASLLSGRCGFELLAHDLHTGVSLFGGGACGFELLTPGGLPTGASLLSGRHVAWNCLHLMICILVYHCFGGGGM